jgi:hypothetical protein
VPIRLLSDSVDRWRRVVARYAFMHTLPLSVVGLGSISMIGTSERASGAKEGFVDFRRRASLLAACRHPQDFDTLDQHFPRTGRLVRPVGLDDHSAGHGQAARSASLTFSVASPEVGRALRRSAVGRTCL